MRLHPWCRTSPTRRVIEITATINSSRSSNSSKYLNANYSRQRYKLVMAQMDSLHRLLCRFHKHSSQSHRSTILPLTMKAATVSTLCLCKAQLASLNCSNHSRARSTHLSQLRISRCSNSSFTWPSIRNLATRKKLRMIMVQILRRRHKLLIWTHLRSKHYAKRWRQLRWNQLRSRPRTMHTSSSNISRDRG